MLSESRAKTQRRKENPEKYLRVSVSARDYVFLNTEKPLAKEIVDVAYRVHTALGPGLFESVYEMVMAYELGRRGLNVQRQLAIPIDYQGIRIEAGFRADLVVEEKIIVEIKSVE